MLQLYDQYNKPFSVDASYKSASSVRRAGAAWSSSTGSADADFIPNQEMLRARNRNEVRNNPLIAAGVITLLDNVIGDGLRAKPKIDREVLQLDDMTADKIDQIIESEWDLFTCSQECDLSRLQVFGSLQRLAFSSRLESGDALILLPFFSRGDTPYRTRIQIVESDRISNPNNAMNVPGMIAGVQMDSNAAPQYYHVREDHPGNMFFMFSAAANSWKKVRAWSNDGTRRNAWLYFERKRPGQTRGIPYFAGVLEEAKQLDRYKDAELMAAVISGMFTVFIKSADGATAELIGALPMQNNESGKSYTTTSDMGLGYGSIVGLANNEAIEIANPQRPNREYTNFVKTNMMQFCAGIGLPYEVVMKTFDASYSASRGSLLEGWKTFRSLRVHHANEFCQPVYEKWLTEAVALGRIPAPGYLNDPLLRRAYSKCQWVGPPMGNLDPVVEIEAAVLKIQHGLSSLDIECTELGRDWRQVNSQLRKEREVRLASGLIQPQTQGALNVAT